MQWGGALSVCPHKEGRCPEDVDKVSFWKGGAGQLSPGPSALESWQESKNVPGDTEHSQLLMGQSTAQEATPHGAPFLVHMGLTQHSS